MNLHEYAKNDKEANWMDKMMQMALCRDQKIEEAKKSHASSSVRSSLDVSEVGSGVMAPEILMEREEKRRRRKQEGKAKTDAEVQAAINLLKKANSTILTYEDKIAKLLKENKEMERKLENVTSKKTN